MIKRPQKLKLNAEMNVVPYIDVMLVLLVIFMVTAPMLTQGIQIDLPKVDANVMPAYTTAAYCNLIYSSQWPVLLEYWIRSEYRRSHGSGH